MEKIEEFCKSQKINFNPLENYYMISTKQISIMLSKELGKERVLEIIKNVWRCL
jgi:hypothetical protein